MLELTDAFRPALSIIQRTDCAKMPRRLQERRNENAVSRDSHQEQFRG